MDGNDFLENKKRKIHPIKLVFLAAAVFLAAFFGIYGLVHGFEIRPGFFGRASAAVIRSLGDIFRNGGERKLAAEIYFQPKGVEESAPLAADNATVSVHKFTDEKQPSGAKPVSAERKKIAVSENAGALGSSDARKNADEKGGVSGEASINNIFSVSSDVPAVQKSSGESAAGQTCGFAAGNNPTRKILINEIAWMGSPPTAGETATQAGNNEWFELKNGSGETVSLAGWRILSRDEKLKIIFGGGEKIKSGQFYLLERADDNSVPKVSTDKIYSGSFSNSGEWLRMFDDSCNLIDEVNAFSGWPGGDNATKRTLERNAGDFGWHTSSVAGGTPGAENSVPQSPAAQSIFSSATIPSDPHYVLSVSIDGSGSGIVTSAPAGIKCGSDCSEEYSYASNVNLTAAPENNSVFDNWSGDCFGKDVCAVTMTRKMSVAANFTYVAPPPVSAAPNPAAAEFAPVAAVEPASAAPPQAPVSPSPGHLVLAAVQIAGAAANNDFIKIYNPTGGAADVSGWKLRKKTSSGADYSIRVFPSGLSLEPGAYFTWANSDNNFSLQIGADVSSTQTLAANNSIALMNSDGATIDSLAWGTGLTNPYIEGSPYPDNPSANQILKRKFSRGIIQNTDNNSQDFEIQ